jgi:DNA-binding transcriptional LysR family regulator
VQGLVRARPDATVNLVSGPNRFLLERLKSRDLDVVVGRLAEPEQMTGLAFEQLYSERLALVVRPGHPLLGGDPAPSTSGASPATPSSCRPGRTSPAAPWTGS